MKITTNEKIIYGVGLGLVALTVYVVINRKRKAKEEETAKELTRESNPRAKRGKFSSQKHKLDDGDHQWHGSPRADDGVHRHILFFVFLRMVFQEGKVGS